MEAIEKRKGIPVQEGQEEKMLAFLEQNQKDYEAALKKAMEAMYSHAEDCQKGGWLFHTARDILRGYRLFMIACPEKVKSRAIYKLKEGSGMKHQDEPADSDNLYDLYALQEELEKTCFPAALVDAYTEMSLPKKATFCAIVDTIVGYMCHAEDEKLREKGTLLRERYIEGTPLPDIAKNGGEKSRRTYYRMLDEAITAFALLLSPNGGVGPLVERGKNLRLADGKDPYQKLEELFLGMFPGEKKEE